MSRQITRKSLARARYLYRRVSLFTRSRGPQLCDIGGVRIALDLSQPLHRFIYLNRDFELEVTSLLQKAVRAGDVIVDIGANFGWHTLTLLVNRPDVGMVYAFEPIPENFDLLVRGIRANGCQDRCDARQLAIGSTSGTVKLMKFEGLDLMHASVYQLADVPYDEVESPVVTLDSLSDAFVAPPAVVKCDVEGSERNVLLGAHNVLSGQKAAPPIWFMEANYETSAMAGYFPWELAEFAARYGYQAFTIRQGDVVLTGHRKGLRHGDVLILAIPELHGERLGLPASSAAQRTLQTR